MPDNNDTSRLLNLRNSNQITDEEYQLLLNVCTNKPKLLIRVSKFIINPFISISPIFSLLIGIIVIFAITYLAYISNGLGQDFGFNGKQIPYFYFLKYFILLWLCISITFLIISKILGGKNLRILDFFAFCGLAIIPLFLVFFIDVISYLINPHFINPGKNETSKFVILYSSILDICAIFLIFWYIVLNFFAFKESSGLNHKRTWVGFIIAMILVKVILSIWLYPTK